MSAVNLIEKTPSQFKREKIGEVMGFVCYGAARKSYGTESFLLAPTMDDLSVMWMRDTGLELDRSACRKVIILPYTDNATFAQEGAA